MKSTVAKLLKAGAGVKNISGRFSSGSALRRVLLGAVVAATFPFVTSDAFAACDASNGTVSVDCSDLVLPQTPPGNSNYTIASGVTVEADVFQWAPFFTRAAVAVSGSVQSLTNNGTIDGKDKSYGVYITSSTIAGDITNNYLITGGTNRTFRIRRSTVNGSIVNNNDIISDAEEAALEIDETHIYGSVINEGDITNTNGDAFVVGENEGSNSIIESGILNNGYIHSSGGDAMWIKEYSYVYGGITNTNEISSSANHAIHIGPGGPYTSKTAYVDFLNNSVTGQILATDNADSAIFIVNSHIEEIKNDGLISAASDGSANAIYLLGGTESYQGATTIGKIINTGEISVCPVSDTCGSGSGGAAIQIGHPTNTLPGKVTVGSITNTGNIYSRTSFGINNRGSLETLNNYQGATGSGGSALTYAANLPTNYNMIVYGDRYGQLAVSPGPINPDDGTGHSGSMTFGIFGGDTANGIAASQLKSRVYEDVVTGVEQTAYENDFDIASPQIVDYYGDNRASFGNYNGVAWMLTDAYWRRSTLGEGVDTSILWDLHAFNFGLDLAEPQRSMLEQRQHAIRNALDYDCTQFDKDGVCVSVKGRYSSFGDYDEAAGILVVSKQLSNQTHIGAYVDQSVAVNDLNGISMHNDQPMFGVFADYYEKKDGTGAQARISTGLHRAKADFSRTSVFGDGGSVSGYANVDSFGVMGKFGWGFAMGNKQVLTPYIGLSFLKASRSAYNESSGVDVLDALNLSSYSEHRTVGTAGLKLSGPASEKLAYRLAVGVDYDLDYEVDSFDVSSAYWGDMSYVSDVSPRELRVNGSAGLDYAVDANKTITLDGDVSQMDYGNLLAYSFIAGFQMGF